MAPGILRPEFESPLSSAEIKNPCTYTASAHTSSWNGV
jgi:hypothetical protein